MEVSIDFPTEREQDAFRAPGNWALVHAAMERCRGLGIEVSILATLMTTNYDRMGELVALARRNGVNLRVNAYQPVRSDRFRLTYAQFWQGYRDLFAAGLVVSCSEPVVRAAMGLGDVESPCARRSIRFNPRGQIIPCVYWPMDGYAAPRIEDLADMGEAVMEGDAFRAARAAASDAANCPCQGGCASRRALLGDLDAHDDYCPWVRGEVARARLAARSRQRPHAQRQCLHHRRRVKPNATTKERRNEETEKKIFVSSFLRGERDMTLMPPKPWKTLSTRIVYENPWTTIREDVAEMPNGKTTIYGVVQNAECVGVLPFVDDDHVVMVRQYRYVFGEDHRWEMPTGGVKPGESLETGRAPRVGRGDRL